MQTVLFAQMVLILLILVATVHGGPSTDSYKDQYCMDPRTMNKHAAYTEWADAYSCTRHRCQPGGRNLAIYTVGCKRVEAPESAIECEEVVEDTNMQFPYCCTRLRCLVVVRGEVWTRVLGQPWEVLPAAPWSHMYKMKRPPPGENSFLTKTPDQGPIYELAETEKPSNREVLRAAKKNTVGGSDCNEVVPRAVPTPDIVIALSTNSEKKEHKKNELIRHKHPRKSSLYPNAAVDEERSDLETPDADESHVTTEKPADTASNERLHGDLSSAAQRAPKVKHQQVAWTEIPQNQWNEHESPGDIDAPKDIFQPEPSASESDKKGGKTTNLQALVDAIGTRMRDIESVVQRMSEKVHHEKPSELEGSSAEKRSSNEDASNKDLTKAKKPSPDADNYKRFSVRNHGSKYLHGDTEVTTEKPLFAEASNMNGYFSDASNSVLRRASPLKEPALTYMAPVDTRRKSLAHILVSDSSDEGDKKRKKHTHKKKRGKGHTHKKHHRDEKRKRFNRLSSAENEKNAVSLEDSSAHTSK